MVELFRLMDGKKVKVNKTIIIPTKPRYYNAIILTNEKLLQTYDSHNQALNGSNNIMPQTATVKY